jgi:hypothetical protein
MMTIEEEVVEEEEEEGAILWGEGESCNISPKTLDKA